MGIDILNLGGDHMQLEPQLGKEQLVQPEFQNHRVANPQMSIWLMTVKPRSVIFPWWRFESSIDEDMQHLSKTWSICSAQGLFDCLVLSALKKFAGSHLFAIFPGNLKKDNWARLDDQDRKVFDQGQACVYQLDGSYDGHVSINWVPFYQPQSLVKNPAFGNMWRMFCASKDHDEGNGITLFSLSSYRLLPEVVHLLTEKDENRSAKLATLVNWFALYSSPVNPRFGSLLTLYTRQDEVISGLREVQAQIETLVQRSQDELLEDPRPRSAIRILTRQIAI
jgi:hypothetical protein